MSDTAGSTTQAAPGGDTGGAPAGGDTGGNTTTTTTETGSPSIREIMEFDPFAPASTKSDNQSGNATTTTPADGTTAGGADNKTGDGKTPPATPAGTAPAATPAKTESQPAATPDLAKMLESQTAAIANAVASAVKPQPSAAADAKPAAKFNLGLPPQIIDGLRSEDKAEFATSMHAVVNGIANHVFETVQKHLTEEFAPQIMSQVQGQQASKETSQQVFQDFYGTHKTLADPMLRPLVQHAGILVAQARAKAGKPIEWSPELRDEVAEMVYSKFPHLRPTAAAQSGGSPPAPRQPFVAGGGGPRPAAAPAGANDFGADLLTP